MRIPLNRIDPGIYGLNPFRWNGRINFDEGRQAVHDSKVHWIKDGGYDSRQGLSF